MNKQFEILALLFFIFSF